MRSRKTQAITKEIAIMPEMYIEKIRQKTEAVDVVIDEKESWQNTSLEEKERQKRRKGKEVTDTEVMNKIKEIATTDKEEETKMTIMNLMHQDYMNIIAAIRNQEKDTKEEEENYEIEQ